MSAGLRAATATLSDTRTATNDVSGRRLTELLGAAGVRLVEHRILPDEPLGLAAFLGEVAAGGRAEFVVLTGGTGISPRDQTHEALASLLEKRLDGFGEAFRRLSWEQIGPRAILSRAMAGTFRGLVVFSLPGSPAAVALAVEALILPIVGHAVELAQGRALHRRSPEDDSP